jgi:hypothetical protein
MNLLDTPADPPDDREAILNKWKDKPVEELLKAKVDSDLYIKTLERQKDELRNDYLAQREELLAKQKFEELIDRYEKAPKDLQEHTPPKEVEHKYDPKEIEQLVLSKIQETESLKKQTDNFNKVQNKLQERFGNNYSGVLKEQQNALGLSDGDVNDLAKKSPEAFFRIMGLNDQQNRESFHTPPRSNQRNDQFSPKVPKRDWDFYQEMKKNDPRVYLDPKIQVQMHNDAQELGAAFFGQT